MSLARVHSILASHPAAADLSQAATASHLGALWLVLIFPAVPLAVSVIARLNVGRERRALHAWAIPFLETGEQFQTAFKVGLPVVFGTYGHLDPHMVVATDRAILVLHVQWRGAAPPRRLPMRLARNQRFGRPHRRAAYPLQPSIILSKKAVVVPRRFFVDVAAADAALDARYPPA